MMSPVILGLLATASGAVFAAIGASIGYAQGRVDARADIAFWRMRSEQLYRRLQAQRSDGREAELFDPQRPRRWIGDHQEAPPG